MIFHMKLKRLSIWLCLLISLTFLFSATRKDPQPRILVFSKTAGFRHGSIAAGIAAIQKLGRENGFRVDTTENSSRFNEDTLRLYSTVIFLNATGDVLNAYQQADFERYIQAGGGYVGIHAAADCEYGWPWYGKLVGAYFKSHPRIQKAALKVVDKNHPSTMHLPDVWERSDEWYNFKKIPDQKDVNVLIRIDEKSYQGGENGDDHPMAWYHEYDGGRAFYTELGHTDESFSDPNYLKHILGGIRYAIGSNKDLNYSKSTSLKVPDEDRFTKNMLTGGAFDEPTEMAILPNLDIIVVQRKGEIMFYNGTTKSVTQAGKLNVYHKSSAKGVNAEEGLMGIAADPDYRNNHFVYMFYAAPDTSMNRLSRFVFKNGEFDPASEKIVLELFSQRQICCHTGGSLAFGPDGLLYLSTGDNATPFNQPVGFKNNGFAPIDHRPGLEQYDASRSSSNTNDLRGKIIRIRVKQDGTYEIPEGNLFRPGTASTKPEIYVMGNRNPYRISIDRKTGFLYWGEVGPDAGNDSIGIRGPRGYDELNQARKAGFFGWPFFVGKNFPYHAYDYTEGKTGAIFDPNKPINNSPNNTGLRDLPPVSPAFIWYPYASSPDFPEVGTGGRNAMAGPVYHAEFYPPSTRFPDYFNGKLFFYDWIRGWIKIVSMDAAGNYEKMEPFMPTTKLNSPIDMEMGPDGRLYILEYGNGWFTKNNDAGLARIDYNGGNRAPQARIKINKYSGTLPLTVKATAAGSKDSEKDALTYVWHFGSSKLRESISTDAAYTFSKPGAYPVYVEVKDSKGAVTRSETMIVYAGNEEPKVSITLNPPSGFYFAGKPVNYTVRVIDKEDGSTEKGGIDPASLNVKVDYLSSPDKAQVLGHQAFSSIAEGRNLAATLDCRTCHKENEKSIGPSYEMVAAKYANDSKARSYLTGKIIKGGSGVWGEVSMAAHPDLKESDASLIVEYILSIGKEKAKASLPRTGEIVPTATQVAGSKLMQISASYTDKGAMKARPLTGFNTIMLMAPVLSVADSKASESMTMREVGKNKVARVDGQGGWIMFDAINLRYVTAVELTYIVSDRPQVGYIVEWFADRLDGTKLGETTIGSVGSTGTNTIKVPLNNIIAAPGKLYVRARKVSTQETKQLSIQSLRFIAD